MDRLAKAFKPTVADYPELNHEHEYTDWIDTVAIIANLQGVQEVLNPNYVPLTPDDITAWRYKQAFVMVALTKKVQCKDHHGSLHY